MSSFARGVYEQKYAWKDDDGHVTEDWPQTAVRVVHHVLGSLGYEELDPEYQALCRLVANREFIPGGRYLYASGRGLHQTQNCLLLRVEDSREGWADLMHKSAMALMTGAGIGIDYSLLREAGAPIRKTGGVASGPIALMKIINEIGRNVMQGGSRRSAIWAGLNWQHPDVFDFIRVKDWSPEIRAMKEKDPLFPADMDATNVSVCLDDEFFLAIDSESHPLHERAQEIYWTVLNKMVTTGEPGFSIDVGENAGETLRNACTEVTSRDDSDICNLGSLNLARFDNIEDFREAVKFATLFLVAGTVYSDVPYERVGEIREKNRRLGLGLMGVHEWLLKRGKPYGPDDELGEWLQAWQDESDYWGDEWADRFGLSRPVKKRALAPNGTIGIIGETTTSIEPIFCVATKRRVREASAFGDKVMAQYVIDPTAQRLVDAGADWHEIEDAYKLSFDVERRVAFQAWVQKFVDHGISSTINLPYPIEDKGEQEEFGRMLLKYLPSLRGITCYPDGARNGQPLTAVPYSVAIAQIGVVFEDNEESCVGGVCGS